MDGYGIRRATRDLDVGREGVKLCSVQRPSQRQRDSYKMLQECRHSGEAGELIPCDFKPELQPCHPSGASPQRFHSSQGRLGQEAHSLPRRFELLSILAGPSPDFGKNEG